MFLIIRHLSRGCVYIINTQYCISSVSKALYIIKPKLFYARQREMIYKGQALDDIQRLAAFDDIKNLATLRFGYKKCRIFPTFFVGDRFISLIAPSFNITK